MPQEILRQTNFNGGELDPRMHGRRELKSYSSMLAGAENVVTTPLGPLNRRPGTTFVDYCRHTLAEIPVAVAMVTCGNGPDPVTADHVQVNGVKASTIFDLGAADHLLITVDFGAPVEVSCIDLVDYAVIAAAADPATAEPPPFVYPYPTPILNNPIDVGPIGGDLP